MAGLPTRLDVLLYYPFMGPKDTGFFEIQYIEQLGRDDIATLDAYFALDVLVRAYEPGAVTVGALAERLDAMLARITKEGSKHQHDVLFDEKVKGLIHNCERLRRPAGLAKVWAKPIEPIVR